MEMEKKVKDVIYLYAGLMCVLTVFWWYFLTCFLDAHTGWALMYSWWVLAPVTVIGLVTLVVRKR